MAADAWSSLHKIVQKFESTTKIIWYRKLLRYLGEDTAQFLMLKFGILGDLALSRGNTMLRKMPYGMYGLSVLRHLLELALVVGAYLIYELIGKYGVPNVESIAYQNAVRVIAWETSLGISWEPQWQAWALENFHAVIVFSNWMYTLGYWPIIMATAIFLYVKNRSKYFYYRNIILVSFGLALIAFSLLPVAPPRFLPSEFGFIDTIARYGPSQYTSRDSLIYYNLFAAMPSLHIGWTLLIGFICIRHARFFGLKVFGIIYPTLTFFGIILTGNHFMIDVAGGFVVILFAFLLYESMLRLKQRMPLLSAMVSFRFSQT